MFTNTGGFIDIFNLIIKIGGILISILYILFALVITRQIGSMKKVVEIRDRGTLLILSYIQLALAIGLLLYSLLIL